MRKPVARAVRSKFNDRNNRQNALRRAALSAAPAGVAPFEALEDRRLFSVLANYYNDGFWGNGNAGRPVTPTNLGSQYAVNQGGTPLTFANQQIMVARAGDVQTTVANIDFDWGTGSPDPAIRPDNHSTLFVGKLVAPTTGTYEILGYGDDDTHVFVDGQLVSSDPGGHGQEDPRGTASVGRGGGATTINLVAGQSYDLAVLHAEGGGGSGVRLRWVLPGGDTANPVAVPAANLTADVTPVTAPTGVTRDTSVTNGVKVDFTDTSKTELRYDLQRRQGTGAWATVASGSINDNSITDYSAKFGTAYEYRVVAWNLQGEAVSGQTVTATLALPAAEPGAQGYYFNDQFWKTRAPGNGTGTDVIVGNNPDATGNVGDVNENWGDGTGTTPGSPAPGVIRTDNFSTAFTGKITAPETGDYYVLGFSDDDSYVWVNGQLVSADPGGHGIPANTATGIKDIDTRNKVTLTAGQSYDFVALQSEGGGGAGLILRWITPTAAQEAADAGVDPIAADIPAEAFTSNQPAPLAAPTALTATATDVSVVRLTWADNAKSEVRYTLERSTSADFSNATRLLLPINTTSYQDTGLTRGTQYFYRLTAENFTASAAATTSVSTPAASSTPAAPTNLVAYNLGTRNRISFTDNAINESGYIVERRLASGGTFAPVAGSPIAGTAPNVSGGTITYDDSDNVVAGQTYVYRVRAVNVDNGQSANSNEATTSVHGLRAAIYDSTGRFAARNFFEQPGKDPVVRIDPNIDFDFGDGANGTPGSPDPTKVDADLYSIVWDGYFTPTTTENYTFYGESDDGIRVFVNGQLVVDQWVDRGTTETAGTPVALTAGQPAEIRVQYYENGGGAVARLRYSTDTIAKQVVPLTQLTPADASNPLRAPTNVDATSFIGQSINVTWLDNTASETGYRVERTSEAPSETTVWQAIGTVPANQSGFIDSNVADPTTTYYYRVVALGAGGTSQASAPTLGSYSVEPDSAAVNFTDFSDPNVQAQWVLNPRGPAGTGSGPGVFVDSNNDGVTDRLRLTDGGAPDDSMDGQIATAYLATPVTVGKGFTSSFDFVVGGPGAQSANPADGFTWILQAAAVNNTSPARTTPVGGGGGGLGYTGIGNSVALKFDIYNQLNQTGLYLNGEGISDDPNFARNRVIPNTFDINSGQRLHVTVSYDPTSKVLTQTIDDVGNDATAPYVTSYVVDIPATLGSGSAYVGFGGATGGETARQEILSFAYNPTAPAASANVSDVYVRGSAWATTFKQYLEAKGLGDDVYGYRLASNGSPVAGPAGNPEQVLPWINLDEVVLKYASAPTGSGIPTVGSVAFTSANGTTYTIASVTPVAGDPTAFVLRLNQPLGGGNLATGTAPTATQNGDHITLGVPGGGLGGGNFSLRMDVLQGDTDHTGETGGNHSVLAADYSAVKKKFFKDTTDTTTGDASYSAFHDVNGSGNILANDFSEVKKRFFQSLAPATTASAQGLAAASATRDLFGNAAIL